MRSLRTDLVDAAFGTVLVALAVAGFGTSYVGATHLVAGGAGLFAGVAVGFTGNRLRLPAAVSVGAGLVALALIGPAAGLPWTGPAGALPSPANLAAGYDGVVHGWWDLITTLPPVGGRDHLRMVPLVCGLAGGLGGMLLARAGRALVPLVAPVVVLVTVLLFGAQTPQSVLLQGAAFLAVAVAWAAVRRARGLTTDGAPRWRSGALGAALLAVAAVAGLAAAPALASGTGRYTLRDQVQPPFDPSAYPSPLAGLRRYEVRDKQTTLFTVHGALPAGARIRISTMDTYDGLVWGVVNGQGVRGQASGVFERVGERIPASVTGRHATVSVTVGRFDDVWLPDIGAVTGIRFAGPHADDLADTFRYNRATGTAVVPVGLTEGDTYTLDVVVPAEPAPETLTGRSFADVTLPDPSGVPDKLSSDTLDWTAGQNGAFARLLALRDRLEEGAYSDGSDKAGVPSRPGHGAGRLHEFLDADQLVGDSEQYAATLALMARKLGIPARVVLGVVPPSTWDGAVTGGMVTAWVEVDVDGAGWVPIDTTPPVSHKPDPLKQVQQPNSDAQLKLPPLVVLPPQVQLPPPDPQDDTGGHDSGAGFTLPPWVLLVAKWAGGPVSLDVVLLGSVVLAKRVRGRRRRGRGTPAARVEAGWTELLDRLADLGVRPAAGGTRLQTARSLGVDVFALARTADAHVFSGNQVDEGSVDAYWARVRETVGSARRTRRRARRFAAAIDPSTLLRLPSVHIDVFRRRKGAA